MTPHEAAAAIEHLVLSDAAVEIAGLAGSSGRSLFLYGPPGNGKTTLAHLLHNALKGHIWVPHCIGVGSDVIVVFDPEIHRRRRQRAAEGHGRRVDRRWVCTQRPFVVAAGELTLDALELAYSPGRYYDAPMHVKANGGTFVIDDLGRQRVEPYQLLNRWLFPLENRADYLTLQSGRKVRVPFRQMLVFSTNLDLEKALDGAFLRRIGYRLRVDNPTPPDYAHVFARYAARCQASIQPGLIEALRERYASRAPADAQLRAARPHRAGARHLPLQRPAARADAGGHGPGLEGLLRRAAGSAGAARRQFAVTRGAARALEVGKSLLVSQVSFPQAPADS